jgi:hypothetical protein
LPRIIEEPRKDASSGTCSKNLFPTSSQSKGATSEGKKDKEQEVDQHVPIVKAKEKGVTNSGEISNFRTSQGYRGRRCC